MKKSVVMNNKSKILMIGPDMNSLGGISSVIKLYKNYGLDCTNLSSYKDGNIFTKLNIYFFFLIKYILILVTNKNIQLVHIHTASRGSFLRKALAFKIAKLFHKKVILHIHGAEFLIFYQNLPNFFKKRVAETLASADLIIVLSKQWKDNILGISKGCNMEVLYNPTVIRKENTHSESKSIRVVFMGRLGKRKGIYDIIEAAKHIDNTNVEIQLYGDGNLEQFEKLIKDANLQGVVKIMGWVSGFKKEEVLKNSDIFILPSYNEGLPMSILEAMAYGLPIISTPVGGISEAVEDGVSGFLIQPGDSEALAEKINLLANNRPLMGQMGQQAYKQATEKFDIKIITRQLQDIYDKILK